MNTLQQSTNFHSQLLLQRIWVLMNLKMLPSSGLGMINYQGPTVSAVKLRLFSAVPYTNAQCIPYFFRLFLTEMLSAHVTIFPLILLFLISRAEASFSALRCCWASDDNFYAEANCKGLAARREFVSIRECTLVWINRKYRRKYWATRSSVRSFARTALSFSCSALLAAITRPLARSLRSLPSSWESE